MTAASKRVISILVLAATVSLFLASCSRDPQGAKLRYVEKGQAYMKKGQYSSAAIEYRNALKIDPKFVDAYYDLARADLAEHSWNDAFAALQQAIQLNPNLVNARLKR
ncbi:MAG: tetratricopeptide repeat protein, partial [Blastocatellia bacterium]